MSCSIPVPIRRRRAVVGNGTEIGIDVVARRLVNSPGEACSLVRPTSAPASATIQAMTAHKSLAYHVATVLGLGDRLPAPGTTAGSLPAVVGWWLAMLWLPDVASQVTATGVGVALVLAVGTWAAGVEEQRRGIGDPGPVVIDEVAGQWLTLLPAPMLLEHPGPQGLAGVAVAAFLLFRFFDIAKPWPVRRIEALPGGIGIMADDLAAACYAAACLVLALFWLS